MIDSSIFNLQSSLEANYLNIPLEGSAELDNIAIKVLEDECPDFLIPFSLIYRNENGILKYKLVNAVALEYSNLTLSKKKFVEMYLNLLTPFLVGKDWFLDYHSICIDKSYVYLDRELTKASFIYIPEKSYHNTDDEIFNFFKEVLNNVTVTGDNSFLVKLYQYFNRGDVTLADLYLLVKEENRKLGNFATVKKEEQQRTAERKATPEVNFSGNNKQQRIEMPVQRQMISAPVSEQEEKGKKRGLFRGSDKKKKNSGNNDILQGAVSLEPDPYNSDDEVIRALFGEDKKKRKEKKEKQPKRVKEKTSAGEKGKGFLGRKSIPAPQQGQSSVNSLSPNMPQPSQNFAQRSSPAGYMPVMRNEATEIYDDNMQMSGGYLELTGEAVSGAPDRIELRFEKPFITLGRISTDSVKPDVAFGSELKRIGRMHARIEKNGENFYIIDLGSANHTSINGEIMIPNYPYILKNGDEVAFATSRPVRYRVNL
ncbi:FHA domain-containing protein [Lachnospiraceae bacterium 38-10]